ncbi:MFS transporter [Phreatobacter sp.]|uniref:MFS transporter n=1 Tax=Phreatobacter sp. TaxID=1966341 RepID=UPI003F6E9522
MSELPRPAPVGRLTTAGLFRIAAPLSVTQMVGWGTTFWLPSMLVGPVGREIGLVPEIVFAAVTVMLLVSAVVAPSIGRLLDRSGARWPMVAGSLIFALALVVLSQAVGTSSYLAAWVLVGIGTPLALSQAAAAAMVQRAGAGARQAIGMLMLVGGLSSTVFWPLAAWLDASVGWRGACLVFAAIHILVCLPIHLIALARPSRVESTVDEVIPSVPEPPALTAAERRHAFILMASAFSLTGFVSWGLPLQIVEILKGYGHSVAFAIFAGTLMGPAQVIARLGEMIFGRRLGILMVGVISAALMPLAVMLPVLGPQSPVLACAFVIGYGLAAGAMTIVRAVAPLALFGAATFATMSGWLAVPQSIAFAIAPMVFAAVMRHWGSTATLVVAFGAALCALASAIMLERHYRGRAAV